MHHSDDYIEDCFLRPTYDEELFDLWCGRLPLRKEDTPYHSGPHSIRQFQSALKLIQTDDCAPRILETGFCLGHSASILLELGAAFVCSIDNSLRPQTLQAVTVMKSVYDNRFEYISGSSADPEQRLDLKLQGYRFDLMFIDGGHRFLEVDSDIRLGVSLGIKYFLLDDYFPHWGPGVQPAMRVNNLIPVAILGTMALAIKADKYRSR